MPTHTGCLIECEDWPECDATVARIGRASLHSRAWIGHPTLSPLGRGAACGITALSRKLNPALPAPARRAAGRPADNQNELAARVGGSTCIAREPEWKHGGDAAESRTLARSFAKVHRAAARTLRVLCPACQDAMSCNWREFARCAEADYTSSVHPARVAESVDAGDSKSPTLRGIRVRVSSRVSARHK